MLTIFFVQLVGLISPGPDFFYVSRRSASSSLRNGLFGAIGISLGVGFWALVAVFGLAFINKYAPSLQSIVMILGGSYLAYSGIKMVKVTKSAQFGEIIAQNEQTSAMQEILKGLLINIANAKVAVFFSSVLSAYVVNLNTLGDILFVLFILIGSTLVYFALVALLFSRQPIRNFYAKYNRFLDNFAGIVFIFFGAKLIFEGISGLIA